MTELDWLQCDDLPMMLALPGHRGKVRSRKVRLFACASARRVWHLLDDDGQRRAVECAERYADGLATAEALEATLKAAMAANAFIPDRSMSDAGVSAGMAAERSAATAWYASVPQAGESNTWEMAVEAVATNDDAELREREVRYHAALLRDIFGNPFRQVTFNPAWGTPTVLALAQRAYDKRRLPAGTLDPVLLAALGDALEEIGCTDREIQAHLRSSGPHVRGCCVVDLILGQT